MASGIARELSMITQSDVIVDIIRYRGRGTRSAEYIDPIMGMILDRPRYTKARA